MTAGIGLSDFLAFTVVGIVIGSAYAIAASGLVITYATSNVFNMAHGAVGMVMAFLYWELASNRGLPLLVSLLVVVCVAAPLFGALVERGIMRRFTNASVTVTLTVTVALLVLLFGLASVIWPPEGRRVEPFFAERGLQLGQVFVSGQELLTLAVALLVAGLLYYLLVHTRTGVAMRGIVDDRGLLALHGARPQLLGMYSWALGSGLAALAGILLVSQGTVEFDYVSLTLLVINAYAAAMVGRLTNLPRTIVGAMILGLLQSYFLLGLAVMRATSPTFVQDWQGTISGLRAALPTIFLFAVMLLMPHGRLRAGQLMGAALVRIPTWRRTLGSGAGLVVAVVLITGLLDTANTARLGQALALALIMLSLVVLTGFGGDVSLAQMAFVGVGALVVVSWFGVASPAAVVVAAVVTGLVGLLIGIPALRLRGLYLGLGTLAFAEGMSKLVFESREVGFALGGSAIVDRPTVLGVSLASERAFTIAVAIGFVAMACFVVAVRRGRFGRLVLATRDSPAACGTLGLSITRTRVLLFGVSAAMAGAGGAFYAGMNVSVGAPNFAMFQSLLLLLLAVVGGVTSVTGALIGGLLLAALHQGGLGGAAFVLVGAAAIALGRNPNGLAGWVFLAGNRLREGGRQPARAEPSEETAKEATAVGAP